MARCKRCGASFDYDKRDGVCPKCCFYNRPPGREQADDEWMKNYNIEDNSYELPKSVVEQEQDRKKSKKGRTSPARKDKTGNKKSSYYNKKTERVRRNDRDSREKNAAPVIGKVILILIFVMVIVGVAFGVLFGLRSENSKTVTNYDISVNTATVSEASEGITAGEITYKVGEAKVLFGEGQLQDLPTGEKCIGIWIEDDESVVDYNGINWERPYVFDGHDYREMVYVDGLEDAAKFEGMDIMSFYLSYYDQAGYAVFFVPADVTTVTLSLPCQSVDPDDSGKRIYQEVMDVVLPITE